jgi:hypothetical protein
MPDARDPAVALQVASRLYANPDGAHGQDPDYAEALAAAQAANGQFAAAAMTEGEAIRRAKRFHWITTRMEQRLATYEANHAWKDFLCDCQLLAPGQWL